MILQNRNRIHEAERSALIMLTILATCVGSLVNCENRLTILATCVGSLVNCENRLAVNIKKGAPGG